MDIGRLHLTDEPHSVDEAAGGERTLALAGVLTSPPRTVDDLEALRVELLALADRLEPLVLPNDRRLDGYYVVEGVDADLRAYGTDARRVDYTLDLRRVGGAEVDLESRLVGPQTVSNAHGLVGERWHAPPAGHLLYGYDAAQPAKVARTLDTGAALTVYRALPLTAYPRWAVAPALFYAGAARLEVDGRPVVQQPQLDGAVGAGAWRLSNGLLRVSWAGGLLVEAFAGGAWRPRLFVLRHGATALGDWQALAVLRNDAHEVAVRLAQVSSAGRVTLDLVLRRGARHVSLYLTRYAAQTLRIEAPTAGTAGAGRLVETAAGAGPSRYVLASAGALTVGASSIERTNTRTLDAMVGVEVGNPAAAGDTAADLFAQYLGEPAETVTVVPR